MSMLTEAVYRCRTYKPIERTSPVALSSPGAPRMPPAQPRFQEAGGHRLPLGGINGYRGVRGKQGRKKDKYQGVTPQKQHRTGLFDSALEAAIAFAQMKEDLDLGMPLPRSKKQQQQQPAALAASRKLEVGTYLGHLPRPQPVVPTVACALLSAQQAAAAAARGVAVAYADAVL